MDMRERGAAAYRAVQDMLKQEQAETGKGKRKASSRKKPQPGAAAPASAAAAASGTSGGRGPGMSVGSPGGQGTASPDRGGARGTGTGSAAASRDAADRGEGFLRAGIIPGEGYRKAAKFLLLIGQDEAAGVLRHLSAEEVEGISREIAAIGVVDREESGRILRDFGGLLRSRDSMRGGRTTAREMLNTAFGDQVGEKLFRKALDEEEKPFSFLSDLDLAQIMPIIRNESPAVISLILPFADPAVAARVLKHLSADSRREVVRRMGRMNQVDPEIFMRIEESVKKKIKAQGGTEAQEIDGRGALAGILRHLDLATEEKLLEELEEANPEIAEEIRVRLFTMDVVLQLDPQDLQRLLRNFTDREIAFLLKGKSDEIRAVLMQNVSQRRRELILDEYRHLGAVPRIEVDRVTPGFPGPDPHPRARRDPGHLPHR